MPLTYTEIASVTLSSASSTLNLTSIPSTYSDLRLVLRYNASTTGDVNIRTNSVSSLTYRQVTAEVTGGASNSATAAANNTMINTPMYNDLFQIILVDFLDYSLVTPSKLKGAIYRAGSGYNTKLKFGGGIPTGTDTVISTINILPNTGTLAIGTNATLYGILRA